MPERRYNPIEFHCRHCDFLLTFPVECAGRVEVCPECANYLDVPEPEEEFATLRSPSVTLPSGQVFHLEMREGLVRPRFDLLIPEIINSTHNDNLEEVFTTAARCWLTELAVSCGPEYRLSESANFHVVLKLSEAQVATVHRHCEQARSQTLEIMQGIADETGHGPHVVLLFHSYDLFYRYVAPFHSEGEYGGASGMFLNEGGYSHIVAPYDRDHWEGTIIHELVHELVSHLPLPLWLNEGVTMLIQWRLTGVEPVEVSPRCRSDLRAFWQSHVLEEFWSGHSFSAPDDRQRFSYVLAFLTVNHLSLEYQDQFRDFVLLATVEDAGSQAARLSLNTELGEVMRKLLGDGSWTPQNQYADDTPGPANCLAIQQRTYR